MKFTTVCPGHLALVVGLLIVAMTVTACGGDASETPGDETEELIEVRLSEVTNSVFTPPIRGPHRRILEDEGLNVDLRTAWGSDRGAAAVISGQADIALAGPEPAIYVHNQDSDDPLLIFAQLTACMSGGEGTAGG